MRGRPRGLLGWRGHFQETRLKKYASARRATLLAALSLAGLLATPAFAQQGYPGKPIRMVVPFPAGGTTDIVARIVAQRMSESMGQPVLVENKAGAGGAIGADVVAKARPTATPS